MLFFQQEKAEEETAVLTLKELPRVLKSLLLENPTYLCLCISISLTSFGVSGSTAFSAKMALFQFRLTASQVSLYFAGFVVTGAVLGNLAGS